MRGRYKANQGIDRGRLDLLTVNLGDIDRLGRNVAFLCYIGYPLCHIPGVSRTGEVENSERIVHGNRNQVQESGFSDQKYKNSMFFLYL
jgi:hypothetical protein